MDFSLPMGLFLLPFAIFPWVLFCAAAGVVTAAAMRGSASYVKSALLGAVIGVACGLTRFYAIDIADLEGLQSPSLVSRVATGLVGTLVITGFAAATGAAVARLAVKSPSDMRRCAMVGAGYGLLIGIAGIVLSLFWYGFTPDFEDRTFTDPTVITYLVAVGIVSLGVNAGLTVIAFLWVRGRRRAT